MFQMFEKDRSLPDILECDPRFISDLKKSCVQFLMENKQKEATELIVDFVEKRLKIFTIRSDSYPEMWIYKEGIYVSIGESYIKEITRIILEENYRISILNEILNKIQADTYVDQKEFFEDPPQNLIAVENGILDIYTKELFPFDSKYHFFNKIPVIFDKNQKCEKIEKFLAEVIKHEDDIKVIYEIFGFLLIREYKYEKSFMFLGNGRNGKSKTLDLMKRFIGIKNCANIPIQEFEKDTFSISKLHKKLANLSGDLSKEVLKNTGYWKSLTGRDLISANVKFKERVDFVNYAKMVFAANELPLTYDFTHAFFSRWILIEFPFTFVKIDEFEEKKQEPDIKLADPNILDKLCSPEELSGLLNEALKGLERLSENNGFSYSKNTEEVRRMWVRKSDSFSAFMMDCVNENWDSVIEKSVLRQRYIEYCRDHKVKVVSEKMIKNVLMRSSEFFVDEVYTDNKTGERTWHWKGIEFKNEKKWFK